MRRRLLLLLFAPLLAVSLAAFGRELSHPEDCIWICPNGMIVLLRPPLHLPVAVPLPVGSGSPEEATFYEVIRRDLELSGWFDLVDPAAHVEPVGTGVQMGEFRFEDWEPTGASGLAKTALRRDGSTVRAEVWVYDVPGRRKLGANTTSPSPRPAPAPRTSG